MAPAVSLPMGARFHPRDEETINYLLFKVTGKDLPCDDFIGTDDLYGDKEPWEIFGDSEERELYFFTVLKKIGKKTGGGGGGRGGDNNKRFSRNVGRGTWSNKGQKDPIYGKRPVVKGNKRCIEIIGYKRSFRYERRVKKGDGEDDDERANGTWLLKEFTLPDKVVERLEKKYKDHVLCVLKRKCLGRKGLGPAGSGSNDFVESGLEYMFESAPAAAPEETNSRTCFDLNF